MPVRPATTCRLRARRAYPLDLPAVIEPGEPDARPAPVDQVPDPASGGRHRGVGRAGVGTGHGADVLVAWAGVVAGGDVVIDGFGAIGRDRAPAADHPRHQWPGPT
jgi:hypothetical protein